MSVVYFYKLRLFEEQLVKEKMSQDKIITQEEFEQKKKQLLGL